MLSKALEVAKESALLASEAIMAVYKTDFDVLYKRDASPSL